MAKTRDFSEVIRNELASNPKLSAEVEKQLLNFSIATLIFNEREIAGLTQKELAKRVGSHQSVIARLEDADYGGHSISMLWKIADALGSELKLVFVPKNQPITAQASVRATSGTSNTIEIPCGNFQPRVQDALSQTTQLTAVA